MVCCILGNRGSQTPQRCNFSEPAVLISFSLDGVRMRKSCLAVSFFCSLTVASALGAEQREITGISFLPDWSVLPRHITGHTGTALFWRFDFQSPANRACTMFHDEKTQPACVLLIMKHRARSIGGRLEI